MLRSHWASIGLIFTAFWLGLVLLLDRGSISATERDSRARNVFPAYRKDDITRVELHGDKGDVVLDRMGDAGAQGGDAPWEIDKERADSHAVDTLLGAIEFATRVRKISDDLLGAARVRGTIAMGAVTYRFTLGQDAPSPKGAAYFQLEGEGTFVVSSDLPHALLEDAAAFRSRTVVPYLSIDLARLSVRDASGKGFAIERIDDVGFKLTDLGVRASREALDGVWLAFADLRATTFLAGFDAGAITIEMVPKDGKPPGKMQLGGGCPGHPEDAVLVRTSPARVVACVPGGLAPRLLRTPQELADSRLFLTRLDEVESIEIANDALSIDLARKGSGWTLRSPEARDLAADESEMASALIGSIVRGEGKNWAPAHGDFSGHGHVTVVRAESHAKETIEIGDREIGVRRTEDGAIGSIDSALLRKLAPSMVAIRGRTIWQPPIGSNYSALSIDCGAVQELVHDKTWTYKTPINQPADASAAIDVAEAIAHVKPDAWAADADDGTFGFEKKCAASLSVLGATEGGRTIRVFLGREIEEGVYARAEGQNPIFVAPHALREALQRVLVDRGALAVDDAHVELVKNGKTIALEKIGGKLGTPDGGALLENVAHAVELLRADEAVHFGAAREDEGFSPPVLEIRLKNRVIRVGRATLRHDQKMYFARTDGVDATFAVAKERIEPLLDPFVPYK